MHRSTLILILIALLLPTSAFAGEVLRVTIDMAIGPVTEKVIGERLLGLHPSYDCQASLLLPGAGARADMRGSNNRWPPKSTRAPNPKNAL